MSKFNENSRKLYFGPILDTFCPFRGKQDFTWKSHFCHSVLFLDFYRWRNFLKKTNEQITRKTGYRSTDVPMDKHEFIGPLSGVPKWK